MNKIGDRWTTIDGYGFTMLAGDYDHYNYWGTVSVAGSHPDADGVMENQVYRNEGLGEPWETLGGGYYLARWLNQRRSDRGLVDMNHAYEDGAVLRFNAVKREQSDERMVRVPPRPDNYNAGGLSVYMIVPRG